MRKYIKTYISKSVDYKAFKGILESEVKVLFDENKAKEILSKIDWEDWLNKKGETTISYNFGIKLIYI